MEIFERCCALKGMAVIRALLAGQKRYVVWFCDRGIGLLSIWVIVGKFCVTGVSGFSRIQESLPYR